MALDVHPEQREFVASNATSIAEAHIPADATDAAIDALAAALLTSPTILDDLSPAPDAWFRAIYADGTPVGFVMLSLDPEQAEYFLWRIMIDQRYQRQGYGIQAFHHLIDYVRTLPNARRLLTSQFRGNENAARFFSRFGFQYTGEAFGESDLVMELDLTKLDSVSDAAGFV